MNTYNQCNVTYNGVSVKPKDFIARDTSVTPIVDTIQPRNDEQRKIQLGLMNDAATKGDLDAIKNFNKLNYPWNTVTFCSAAGSNNLEMVKFLHKNACPADASAFRCAVEKGNNTIVSYIAENKLPMK